MHRQTLDAVEEVVDRSLDVVVFDAAQLYIEGSMKCIILDVVEKEVDRPLKRLK